MRPVGFGALLHVAVGKRELAVQDLDDMHSGPTSGRNGQARRSRRGDRRDPAREIVIVKEQPAILERPPSDPFDLDPDRGSHRAGLGRQLHAHVHGEPRLDVEALILLQYDVVNEAKIFGNGEDRGELAGRIGPDGGDFVGNRVIFAAVIFRPCYLPVTLDGGPDQLELRVGRQRFGNDTYGRARRAMLRRNPHSPDEAVQWGEWHLAPDLRGRTSGCQQGDGKKNAARRGKRTPDHQILIWRGVRKYLRSPSAVRV